MPRWCLILLLVCAACEQQRDVTVIASIPGVAAPGSPTAGFAFVALPYDRDSLVSAFEARARVPRPSTEALDSLFAQYRAPFAAYTALVAEVDRYGDSLATLKQRLEQLPRAGAEYNAAYAQWMALRDSLHAIDAQAARARANLNAARPRFVARSESLRTALRDWQDSTFAGYNAAADSIVHAQHREPIADTTDASGSAALHLEGGPWWIYARSWDSNDPNAEWYWNVPVTSDTVRLDAQSGVNRPRY